MKLKMNAPLDPGFMPMAVVYREFEEAVAKEGGQKLTIGLERNDGLTSTYTVEVFKDGTGHDEENHEFVERLVKTLLWTRGGYKIIIAGSKVIADRIKAIQYAIDNHQSEDVILLCGKGHEDYQIIGHEKIHMDEREIVADYLKERAARK